MSRHVVDPYPARLDSADMPACRLIEEINQITGLQLSVRRRCTGGEQGGAWVVQTPADELYVLKWRAADRLERRIRTAAAVDRIVAAGYPTPPWRLVGGTPAGICYHLLDFLPGDPISLTPETAVLMAEVIEKQAGLAPDLDRDWSTYITANALDDDDQTGPRQFVRDLGPAGQALIEHYDAMLTRYGRIDLPRSDLVHGDFSTGNVLIHQGRISGMVDIDALGNGTRIIDYAWLVREVFGTGADPAAADVLRRRAENVAGPDVLALCVTATALDMVRWVRTRHSGYLKPFLVQMHALADYLVRPL